MLVLKIKEYIDPTTDDEITKRTKITSTNNRKTKEKNAYKRYSWFVCITHNMYLISFGILINGKGKNKTTQANVMGHKPSKNTNHKQHKIWLLLYDRNFFNEKWNKKLNEHKRNKSSSTYQYKWSKCVLALWLELIENWWISLGIFE